MIALACLGVERAKREMLFFSTVNCFWQDKSVKHKQLQRHLNKSKDEGRDFHCSDVMNLDKKQGEWKHEGLQRVIREILLRRLKFYPREKYEHSLYSSILL